MLPGPISRLRTEPGLLLLGAALALGAFFRFFRIGQLPLSPDEMVTWLVASERTLPSMLEAMTRQEYSPPGFHLMVHGLLRVLPDSNFTVRLPSAVAGTLSVLGIYLVGRRLFSWREGLVAAFLLAVAWCPVHYARESRAYGFLIFFSLLTTWTWIPILRAIQHRSPLRLGPWTAYFFSAFPASYVHYYATYLVLLQGMATLAYSAYQRHELRKLLVGYLLCAALFIPQIASALHHANRGMTWITRPGFFHHYFKFFFADSWPVALAAAFALLAASAAAWCRGRRRPPWEVALLLGWLIVPFLGAYAISRLRDPILVSRYLLISLPPAYLLLARALTFLLGSRAALATAALAVGLGADTIAKNELKAWNPTDHLGAARAVLQRREECPEGPLLTRLDADHVHFFFRRAGLEHRSPAPSRLDPGTAPKDQRCFWVWRETGETWDPSLSGASYEVKAQLHGITVFSFHAFAGRPEKQ